jgi:hypothetical protein
VASFWTQSLAMQIVQDRNRKFPGILLLYKRKRRANFERMQNQG